MNWIRNLLRAWAKRRYEKRFYDGYAFGMKTLESSTGAAAFVDRANVEGWLFAAEHYGLWDAFDEGMRAALRDFDARQRGLDAKR